MWLWIGMLGCSVTPVECDAEACASVCATAAPAGKIEVEVGDPPPQFTDFERSLLDPRLDDLRQGVRPRGTEGIGICEGQGRDCGRYIGTAAPDLPPGAYALRAELDVPALGERGTWKVQLDLECTLTKTTANGSTTSTTTQSREYEVIHAGADRGYTLAPLWKIDSPNKFGAQECKYKLTGPHPDGDKVYTGHWSVPGA